MPDPYQRDDRVDSSSNVDELMKEVRLVKPSASLVNSLRELTRESVRRRADSPEASPPRSARPIRHRIAFASLAAGILILAVALLLEADLDPADEPGSQSIGAYQPAPMARDHSPPRSMAPPEFVRSNSDENAVPFPFGAGPTGRDGGPRAGIYSIHEWGVIPLGLGEEEALEILRRDLPEFIRQAAPEGGARFSAPPTCKPIVYFYPEDPKAEFFSPDIRFGLANGRIRYFWPPGDASAGDSVFWRHNVFWGARSTIDPRTARPVPAGHWIEIAREPEAAWLRVRIQDLRARKTVEETERFLFYDGQIPYASPLRVRARSTRDDPGATAEPVFAIDHFGSDPVHDVLVIENPSGRRGDARIGIGEGRLNSGDGIEVTTLPDDDPISTLGTLLEAAGLYEAEATGMARIWSETFFERQGRWLLWRLDPSTVDEIYPMHLNPAPRMSVRVHLVIAPLVLEDARLRASIDALIERLMSPDFEVREEASSAIRALGPRATVYLIDSLDHEDPEVRGRVEALIDQLGRPH